MLSLPHKEQIYSKNVLISRLSRPWTLSTVQRSLQLIHRRAVYHKNFLKSQSEKLIPGKMRGKKPNKH